MIFNLKIGKFLQNFNTTINPISGPGDIVEIDETAITKRKYNRGRLIPSQWVVGRICRKTKKFFIVSVLDRKQVILFNFIRRHIMPGTLILTNCWRGYRNMESHPYHHLTIIHSQNFVNPLNSTVHTQNIETLWSVLRRFSRRKGTNMKEVISYISGFIFKNENDIASFNLLLQIS